MDYIVSLLRYTLHHHIVDICASDGKQWIPSPGIDEPFVP